MLYHEPEYINRVSKFLEEKEKTEWVQDFSRKTILNCYAKISMIKTAEVNKKFLIIF